MKNMKRFVVKNNYLCSHKSELAGMATKQATSPLIQQKKVGTMKKSYHLA